MKGSRIPYSAEEMAWLESNRGLIISDYHHAFCEGFGRADVSAVHLHSLRKRKGWKVGRAPGRTAGRHWRFSGAEIAWLSANRALEIADYHLAFCAAFGRQDITAAQLHALRKRQGWKTGRSGKFSKGNAPANKGRACPEGRGGRHPNARRTQFRKGELPSNTKFLGHERVRTDGFVEISIAETNPYTGFHRRYVLKHKHLWEKLNGTVPKGHCLKALDGDRTNTDPANWELIPRAVLLRLNGGPRGRHLAFDDASPEVRPALIAIAKVDHKMRELRRGSKSGSRA